MYDETKKALIVSEVLKGKKRASAFLPLNGDYVCCTQMNKLRWLDQCICLAGEVDMLNYFSNSLADNVECYIDAKDTDDVKFCLVKNGELVLTDETPNVYGVISFVVEVQDKKTAIICLIINNTEHQRSTRWIACSDEEYLNFLIMTSHVISLMKGGNL